MVVRERDRHTEGERGGSGKSDELVGCGVGGEGKEMLKKR